MRAVPDDLGKADAPGYESRCRCHRHTEQEEERAQEVGTGTRTQRVGGGSVN